MLGGLNLASEAVKHCWAWEAQRLQFLYTLDVCSSRVKCWRIDELKNGSVEELKNWWIEELKCWRIYLLKNWCAEEFWHIWQKNIYFQQRRKGKKDFLISDSPVFEKILKSKVFKRKCKDDFKAATHQKFHIISIQPRLYINNKLKILGSFSW